MSARESQLFFAEITVCTEITKGGAVVLGKMTTTPLLAKKQGPDNVRPLGLMLNRTP